MREGAGRRASLSPALTSDPPPSMKPDPQPDTAAQWRAEGDACIARGDVEAALRCFESACALEPADANHYQRLAATLAALSRFAEAEVRYREAVSCDAHNADLHHGLGWTLEQLHRLDAAVDAYREAVRLNPRADGSSNNMGNCLHAIGRFDDAHEAYRRAIYGAPRVPLYNRNFVQTKRLAADDPIFAQLEQLAGDAASLERADQAELHFAYGAALSGVGRDDASFDHLLKGNALYRESMRYNEAESPGLFARLPELFDADALAAVRGIGDPAAAPVFIVGMPRSGSTLIEQILASHPRVFGAGERTEFGEALVHCLRRDAGDPLRINIEALEGAGASQWSALGADYLRRMERVFAESEGPVARFTDKYPFNFINVGLIHLALPNARIILSRRSPLQTCLSIFSRIFTTCRSATTSASWAAITAHTMR
jgi:tetratricopeptide (TPR) repeat protein